MSAAAATIKPKGLNCPNCGGGLTVRGFEHTVSVVCPQCLSILDAKNPDLQVLQQFKHKERVTLKIPLGSRGKWRGGVYEVIGFQQRTIHVDGLPYSWGEYLLFNPYRGYRYLTEYNGHWNDVYTLRSLPEEKSIGKKARVVSGGETFTHFQTANAETTFVLGEFPWQVKRGEKVVAMDYVAPPKILSSESTEKEVVWSHGEYVRGQEIWDAFKLKEAPPPAIGVFANQPSPHTGRRKGVWKLYWMLLFATLSVMLLLLVAARDEEVFRHSYTFTPGVQAEASFVTPIFELKGRPSNVEIDVRTDLANNWAYFSFALINEDTGTAYDFGREVSYYFGRDSDGSWSEGSAGDAATVPAIPAGRYYLRVEPEMAPEARFLSYELRVRRDVAHTGLLWLVAGLLLIPPIFITARAASFEFQRWQESDYATSSGDD